MHMKCQTEFSGSKKIVINLLFTEFTKTVLRLKEKSGSEVIKLFSCSTQLSMKISLLINMKMPTTVGIFIFISRENLCSAMFSKTEFGIVSNLRFISMKNFMLS